MRPQQLRSANGSALITAAVFSAVLAILVSGVLSAISTEYNLNMRSHQWNQSLHLGEAGVELAFGELNYQYFRGAGGFEADEGWTSIDTGVYVKTITNFSTASGKVLGDITITVADVGTPYPKILGQATCPTNPRGPSVSRAVRVGLGPSSMFPMGLVAKQEIDLKGNRIYTDSFDSTDPAKSSSGRYDIAKRQANGDVASNGEFTDTISVGNADIYGLVHTGVGGTIAMGPSGSVGSTFAEDDRATSVEDGAAAGYIRNDFGVDIDSVTLPSGLTSATSLGNVDDTTTLGSGDWQLSQLQLNNNESLTISGTVRLYVTGNVSLMGSTSSIIITPGSHLEVYVAGSVSIAGNGVVNNTGAAENNQFFGLSSSTSWSVSGNGQWVGTIYAPDANVKISGGGSSGDMSGGIVANNLTLDGQVQFHYDESLRENLDLTSGFVVTSWQAVRLEHGVWVNE